MISGVSAPGAGEGVVLYVQIKDLRPNGAPATMGPVPTAKRAAPIESTDLLVPSRGEEVAAVRASQAMVGGYVALDVYLVRPDLARVDPDYLLVALNSGTALKQFKTAATVGTLPRIPKHALEDVVLPLPSRTAQDKIAKIGALAQRFEAMQRQKAEAEARLHATVLSRILDSAA